MSPNDVITVTLINTHWMDLHDIESGDVITVRGSDGGLGKDTVGLRAVATSDRYRGYGWPDKGASGLDTPARIGGVRGLSPCGACLRKSAASLKHIAETSPGSGRPRELPELWPGLLAGWQVPHHSLLHLPFSC